MPARKRARRDDHDVPRPSTSSTEQTAQKKPRRVAARTLREVNGTEQANGDVYEEFDLADFPTRPTSLWKFGPHVSAAGGVENAVLNAAKIG